VYAIPSGDFEELYRELGIMHQVCLASILAFNTCMHSCQSPRVKSVCESDSNLRKSLVLIVFPSFAIFESLVDWATRIPCLDFVSFALQRELKLLQ
jgi:hypothetical protein